MKRIRVALAGVGNCASALVQGVFAYSSSKSRLRTPLLHPTLAGYGPKSIEFVRAFDIDSRKVGKDLSEAIFAEPNRTPRFYQVPRLNVTVQRSELLDGIGNSVKNLVRLDESEPVDVSRELRESGADILVNLIPTGANRASRYFASASLKAGCAFINATPAAIASSKKWQSKFSRARLPLAGDDLIDQVGATILHKVVLELLVKRGVLIEESYQLDIGGGTESLNALDKKRYEVKRKVKRRSVSSAVPYSFPLVAGTSDYVEFMRNARTSYFWISGSYFGDTPVALDMTLRILDGPAGAGTLIDVIRLVKLAKDRGVGGALKAVSAYAFKMPPVQAPPDTALSWLTEFIESKSIRC
jgi:myo-inositol-1-phosphate synthase